MKVRGRKCERGRAYGEEYPRLCSYQFLSLPPLQGKTLPINQYRQRASTQDSQTDQSLYTIQSFLKLGVFWRLNITRDFNIVVTLTMIFSLRCFPSHSYQHRCTFPLPRIQGVHKTSMLKSDDFFMYNYCSLTKH